MANKSYIERLQQVISHLHHCDSRHTGTAPVHEIFQGLTVWKGEVQVFDLIGHQRAKRSYGWSHPEWENDQGERFVTVLEIPPVDSPITAVRAAVVGDSKKRRK